MFCALCFVKIWLGADRQPWCSRPWYRRPWCRRTWHLGENNRKPLIFPWTSWDIMGLSGENCPLKVGCSLPRILRLNCYKFVAVFWLCLLCFFSGVDSQLNCDLAIASPKMIMFVSESCQNGWFLVTFCGITKSFVGSCCVFIHRY